MSIPKKPLGDWGVMIPSDSNPHFTFTNENSHEGPGFHVTTQIGGVPGGVSVRDYFDNQGNHLRTGWSVTNKAGK